jgi:hypothetical protein
MSVRVSFGLCRECPAGENGAVLVHRLGLALAYEPKRHTELATEIEAAFPDPFTVSGSDA